MTAVLFQPRDSFQSAQSLLREFRHRDIAESASHLARVKEQAKICGRNARCNLRVLSLDIVGNQRVMLFRAELGKIPPSAKRGYAKQPSIALRSLLARSSRGPVQPRGDRLAAGPQEKNGQRWQQGAGPCKRYQEKSSQRD